ncbi:MAG TPA: flagellar biosynthetic protein FliO [Conexibacter sp.]|nr:flagellar biosynthetic protein FliO [Conexibacter sp.]
MTKASLLTRAAATFACVALLPASPALAAGASAPARSGESTPVDLTGASNPGGSHVGGGGSIVRTIVGLAIVIGVIYGVAWVLRQVKASRQPKATGSGLAPLASVPLGSGRSVQLVRAGTDLVLLGVAEQGVVPIRTYTQEEARAAGLVDDDGLLILPAEQAAPPRERRMPRVALPQLALPKPSAAPRPKLALPAAGAGGRGPSRAVEQLRAWTVRS